ncbi:MAG: FHA domain-containing protein [Deltaproteobacteria bacterium]|nr:FHA domain-containing protein [Deltaproteobacteria bacterium]
MIRCSECGHENMDGLEYCDACGAKLPVGTPAEPAAVAVPAVAPVVAPEPPSAEASAPAEPAAVATAAVTPATPAPAPTPSTGTIQQAQLTILRGGTVGKVFPLQAGDNLVGRWDPDSGSFPEVDMEHDDPEARISRKHALIRMNDAITIEDIGSLNGTFVNRGKRLEPGSPAELKDGDEVIVGKTFFKLSIG